MQFETQQLCKSCRVKCMILVAASGLLLWFAWLWYYTVENNRLRSKESGVTQRFLLLQNRDRGCAVYVYLEKKVLMIAQKWQPWTQLGIQHEHIIQHLNRELKEKIQRGIERMEAQKAINRKWKPSTEAYTAHPAAPHYDIIRVEPQGRQDKWRTGLSPKMYCQDFSKAF